MSTLDTIALLVTLTALFSYFNARFVRLPTTIGLMLIALLLSLALVAAGKLGWALPETQARAILEGIDFNQTLMHGMLSFLLFAGALHVNLGDLSQQKWVIGTLASFGVIFSTFVIGFTTFALSGLLGLELPLIYCLLFGALISPTDPIAVLGILKSSGAPKTLATKIAGESLFNDGVGVVVFIALLGVLNQGEVSAGEVAVLFAEEALGGALFGLFLGWLGFSMLSSMDNYQVEVLITLALVMGGYALAHKIHVSGPIAVVVAGLWIGNHGRLLAMSDTTREHIDTFWELLDEVLNALLFVLIGLEVLLLSFAGSYLLAGLLLIPLTLLARFMAVGLPILLMRRSREFTPHAVKVMTWGGLRGGISVALALSLPAGAEREAILAMTYVVVIFSIVVQGLSIAPMLKRLGLAGQ